MYFRFIIFNVNVVVIVVVCIQKFNQYSTNLLCFIQKLKEHTFKTQMEEKFCAQNGQNLNWFPGITTSDYVSSNVVHINIPFVNYSTQ